MIRLFIILIIFFCTATANGQGQMVKNPDIEFRIFVRDTATAMRVGVRKGDVVMMRVPCKRANKTYNRNCPFEADKAKYFQYDGKKWKVIQYKIKAK